MTHFGVLVPLAVIGLWSTWAERRRLWILYAMAITYAASTVAFYVFARYRYPLVPILMVFAAAGAVALAPSSASARRARRGRDGWHVAANWPMLSTGRMRAITETNLGVALFERGQTANAQARYRAAMAIEPDYVPAYNNLGVALRAQGRVAEAIAAYENGLRHRGDYPDLHYNLGNALSEAGRPAEAPRRRSGGRSPLEPDSAAAHRNLGNLLAAQGEPGGRRHGLPAPRPEAGPRRRAGWLRPGDAAARGATVRRGQEALRRVVRLRPGHAEAHNNLGIALASQGRIAEAEREFEAARRFQARSRRRSAQPGAGSRSALAR